MKIFPRSDSRVGISRSPQPGKQSEFAARLSELRSQLLKRSKTQSNRDSIVPCAAGLMLNLMRAREEKKEQKKEKLVGLELQKEIEGVS